MKISKGFGLAILLGAIASTPAFAAKQIETATLKDLQTVGSTNKLLKHQQYDLSLDTATSEYTCRSKLGSNVKPTQFPVGSSVGLQIDGQKMEVRNTAGNKIKCSIVRVAPIAPPQ